MGWRSWNSMGPRVNQTKMEIAMEALARKRSGGTSLADLGYATAGLDDAWQACGTGVDGSFHDANGAPLVNTNRWVTLVHRYMSLVRVPAAACDTNDDALCASSTVHTSAHDAGNPSSPSRFSPQLVSPT